jgi:alpha-N-acetylglucosaminidase
MALHGIDLVFSFTGQEYLWRETYRELGLNDSQIQSGFNGASFSLRRARACGRCA